MQLLKEFEVRSSAVFLFSLLFGESKTELYMIHLLKHFKTKRQFSEDLLIQNINSSCAAMLCDTVTPFMLDTVAYCE